MGEKMKPKNWDELLDVVKAGKIEALRWNENHRTVVVAYNGRLIADCYLRHRALIDEEHLCVVLRRWIESEGYAWTLNSGGEIRMAATPLKLMAIWERFHDGTETENHIAAALWVAGFNQ